MKPIKNCAHANPQFLEKLIFIIFWILFNKHDWVLIFMRNSKTLEFHNTSSISHKKIISCNPSLTVYTLHRWWTLEKRSPLFKGVHCENKANPPLQCKSSELPELEKESTSLSLAILLECSHKKMCLIAFFYRLIH